MKRRTIIKLMAGTIPGLGLSKIIRPESIFSLQAGEKSATGPFEPNWESLKKYQVPDWFRDAKFGIWAHWGPQCQPEHGDWYARSMYIEGSDDYKFHLKKYGHPSQFGFKDIINKWKAENWNPEQLVELYKRAGAKYFVAMANHHDNFDTYNSKYQDWNATKIGPKKDLMLGWANAARNQGLRFGVSVHAAHAWTFYEKSQKSDTSGAFAGIPYDGNTSKNSGKNTWWEGFDPQELYAQRHSPGINSDDQETFFKQWDWSHGASTPDKKYCEKFYNRTIDLIDQYHPDLVYFDDTVLPLYPVTDFGLRITAHLYNSNIKRHAGRLEAVITGKVLDEKQRRCIVWDIERGHTNDIEPLPWQTDTCIGNWHYDNSVFEKHEYKKAKSIILSLIDIVSKNGNLLLNIPVRGDGTIDADELAIVEEIAEWIKINGESIFGTRPWKIFGEGPAIASAGELTNQGFNEDSGQPFTSEDIRFTQKAGRLYAIALGTPLGGKVVVKTLTEASTLYRQKIGRINLLGSDQPLVFERNANGLTIDLPENTPNQYAYSFRILPL